jgi:hypothetical protein
LYTAPKGELIHLLHHKLICLSNLTPYYLRGFNTNHIFLEMLKISINIFLKEQILVKKSEFFFREYYFLKMEYTIGLKTNA